MEKVDRLTELPESIIHHIISFLPLTDATKTTILSSKFRSLWYSFPFICFNESRQTGMHRLHKRSKRIDIFLRYVHDFLRLREPNVALERFTFRVGLDSEFHEKSDHRIDSAIGYALENHVKELDLDVVGDDPHYISYYRLPSAVFSAKSIALLKLKGFLLEPQDLILTSSFMEDLTIERCSGMKTLQLSCDKLMHMNIKSCNGLENIDVAAPNMLSFSFDGELGFSEITFSACKSLKHLSLENTQISDACLMCGVSRLLMLETLKLRQCYSLENLSLHSPQLKTIAVERCLSVKKLEVVAPNLESFVCNTGEYKKCIIKIEACKLLRKIALEKVEITNQWIESTVSDELALLEDVKLFDCNIRGDFKICHEKLKSFQLLYCQVEEAEIDARNLISLVCSVGALQPKRLALHSPQADVKLFLESTDATTNWFLRLRDVLASMGHCRELKLICSSEKLLMVPEDLRESLLSPLYDLKRLKVEIINKPKGQLVDLISSLLWLAPHPNFISILLDSREKILKLQYSVRLIPDENQFCCQTMPIKCWRHYLKELTMENFETSERNSVLKYITKNAMRLEATYDQ
ncbi:putative F-box/FBD/LRR-repeat protein At3g49040 [Manihot esculenta]|nr:putative F-box/FBD/LRR-repeat protein At3g49040 [Manihot esculenta]